LFEFDGVAQPCLIRKLAGNLEQRGARVHADRTSARRDPLSERARYCAASTAHVEHALPQRHAKQPHILVTRRDLTVGPGTQFKPRSVLARLLVIKPCAVPPDAQPSKID
jgi:hypothetical protein